MSKANLAKEHDILHYKIHLKWSFPVCSRLRNRVPKIYFALQEITSMAKDVWGRKGKNYKGQIVPGKGMAIGVEYETGIAKIGNKVKAIISTQLWNFWGGS